MAGLVIQLQHDLATSNKSVTELLRMAKVISSKLDLAEISDWIGHELSGYATSKEVPDYRKVSGARLEVFNPYRGWQLVEPLRGKFAIQQSAPSLELLCEEGGNFPVTADRKFNIESEFGSSVRHWNQRLVFSGAVFTGILQSIRDRLLDWALELEQRGIKGENMSFDEKEKSAAQTQVFNIQNMHGVAGNVSNSTVTVYDYSSIHQTLKQAGISQEE